MKTKTKVMLAILALDFLLVIDHVVENRVETTVMNMLELLRQCV